MFKKIIHWWEKKKIIKLINNPPPTYKSKPFCYKDIQKMKKYLEDKK